MDVSESLRIAAIRRVSPSRAASLLRCALSEAFRAAQTVPRLPTHPKAHFGVIAHDFLARAAAGLIHCENSRSSLQDWRKLVESYEETLRNDPSEASVLPLSRSCEDFEVNALLIVKASVFIGSRSRRAGSELRVRTESHIVSQDGQIAGRLDKIRSVDGRNIITDFKTGSSTDATGNLREEILLQLKLYAYLAHEASGEWPIIEIQPQMGDPIPVPYDPGEIDALAGAVKERLQVVNEQISDVLAGITDESQLASPSPSACRFCPFRVSCAAYWKARSSWAHRTKPPDIDGRLVNIRPQGGEILLLEIETEDGASSVRAFRSSMLRGDSLVEVGKRTRICELWRERAPRTYSCRPMTVLLQF